MTDSRPRNDAAMAEILASIRRIVADEDRLGAQASPVEAEGDVLILTREMRIDADEEGADWSPEAPPQPSYAVKPSARGHALFAIGAASVPAPSAEGPEAELSVDEAAVVDIARIVLRDEFEGAFGRNLTEQITQLVRAEVARALAEQGRARE